MRLSIIFALVIGGLCSPAQADIKGRDLKAFCDVQQRPSEAAGSCTGYVAGTVDAFRTVLNSYKLKPYCLPAGVSGEQILGMTKDYLASHPEHMDVSAANLIMVMLLDSFPCQ